MATNKKSYADLSFDFTANPQTGDVATVKDAVSSSTLSGIFAHKFLGTQVL